MSESDDEVEYELEDFQIGSHLFKITTIAFMPISKFFGNSTNIAHILMSIVHSQIDGKSR